LENKIAILVPCGNSVDPKAFQSGMLLSANAAEEYKVEFIGVTERMLVHTSRNVLAEGFLGTDCDWAFWLDSDMILPPRTIRIMMKWAKELNSKFLTGVYYQRHGEHKPVIGIKDESLVKFDDEYSTVSVTPSEGCKLPFKVDACGFGCVLIHRDVFKDMVKPYFFNGMTKTGKEFSEDYHFCMNARKLGIEIWAIPELDCGHIGEPKIVFRKDCQIEKKELANVGFYESRKQN